MKTCIQCHESKPPAEFYAHPKMADGRLGKCKACCRAYVASRYHLLRSTDLTWYEAELDRQRKKARRARVRGDASDTRDSAKKWGMRNRLKRHAHNLVAYAVHRGTLLQQSCEVCGEVAAQAHHDDYSKPLDVRWLCCKCHAAVHVELNRKKRAEAFKP